MFGLSKSKLSTATNRFVQWIEGGKIHREPVSRETPRFELFFDLLFVAIIHQLADAAIGQSRVIKSPNICCLTVHRGAWRSFCSSIYPHLLAKASPALNLITLLLLSLFSSWSVWEEARKFANQSGTDDLLHRLWILIGMMTLIGYTANASAIELEPTGEEEIVDHSAVRAAVAFWLVIKLTRGEFQFSLLLYLTSRLVMLISARK